MTREEAIRLLSGLMFKGKLKEALDMAIKELEQESTTKNDLEVDAVLHLEDGRYALIEIKLGNKDIKKGIANLLKVKELIIEHNKKPDVLKMREPDLLMVITGHGISYESGEGVFVIPISCLKD